MGDESFKQLLKTFGGNIKKYSEQKNISIEELSAKTGIRTQYIKKIFEGNCPGISTNHLFALSDALDVPPHKLVEGC